MIDRNLDSAVAAARALGHPARLRVVAMLRTGELCVCQVAEVLGLAASTVSAHLKELKRCGLVQDRKEGRWVYVRLSDEQSAGQWVTTAVTAAGADPQFVDDARLVAELRSIPVEDLCRLGLDAVRASTCPTAAVENGQHAHGGKE